MILVVIGHVIQQLLREECNDSHLWNLIYSFHMPAFMALSGWLTYRKTNTPPIQESHHSDSQARLSTLFDALKRRTKQLLVPYILWSLLSFAISGNYSFERLARIVIAPDSYFWFLWCLFWICLLFKTTQWLCLRFRINENVGLLGVAFLLLVLMVGLEIRVCGFQFTSYYFLFYTIGYMIRKYPIRINTIGIIALSLVWFGLAWGWTMHGVPSWVPAIPHCPATLMQYAYRGFTAFVAIVVLLNLAPKVFNASSGVNGFVANTGVYSLGMYVCHIFVCGYIVLLLSFFGMPYWVNVPVGFALCFAIAWGIVSLISKNKVVAGLLLGKNK
jgi:fucose 4-O-acetylase-like acetyltransferase